MEFVLAIVAGTFSVAAAVAGGLAARQSRTTAHQMRTSNGSTLGQTVERMDRRMLVLEERVGRIEGRLDGHLTRP